MSDTTLTHSLMPARAPLAMPDQSFRDFTRDPAAPKITPGIYQRLIRAAVSLPALVVTAVLLGVFADWLALGGLNAVEYLLILLVGLTFSWIALSVSTATMGLLGHLRLIKPYRPAPVDAPQPLEVALLIPAYNEPPSEVFGNAAAMAEALNESDRDHRFSLFILSDTRDPDIAAQEDAAIHTLRAALPGRTPFYYRRREHNTDGKAGNIIQWVENWGAGYDAMLVLDADSLMSARAIETLSDALARDPGAGLIQSGLEIVGARSLFARMQQFANTAYGGLLSHGLALWTRRESNFWGHNAIFRTRAYAAAARLPKLKNANGSEGLILSHDFVEAALLRRAGWAVRFLPEIGGSYEETPATFIDYAIRDRRWCHGNMQHLRLLGGAGLNWVSRYHMMHGAFSYLLSPAWFILLVFWAVLGNGEDASVLRYFSAENPLYPQWPELKPLTSLAILCFMYAMLMIPKLMGVGLVLGSKRRLTRFGGTRRFLTGFLVETVASIFYAPIMMVQQTISVLRSAIGMRARWVPQNRDGGSYGVLETAKFHAVETVLGVILTAGIVTGMVSLWLLPIMLSLLFAVPLSMLSGLRLTREKGDAGLLATPHELFAPRIIRRANVWRTRFGDKTTHPLRPMILAAE